MLITQSIALFLIAGLCEIGGGYLMWQWWRNGQQGWIGLLSALILIARANLSACRLWACVEQMKASTRPKPTR